jgi:hypothetical protein
MCGFLNIVRRYLEGRPSEAPKVEVKESKPTFEKKKAALDFLDEEIQSLNKNTKKDTIKDIERKSIKGVAKDDGWGEDEDVAGDLDFNDLEI